jgi:hypothetical protein
MSEHVRMNWERKLRSLARSLDHPQKPSSRDWSASFGNEHIRAPSLQGPQGPELGSMQWMNTLDTTFGSIDM